MNVLYDLAFKMSIMTRGDEIEKPEEFNELTKKDDMFSAIVGPEGIAITSLEKIMKYLSVYQKMINQIIKNTFK